MSGIRPIIDEAVAAVLAEHPKYFTPKGHEHARTVIVRKVMAGIRGDGSDKPQESPPTPTQPQSSLIDPISREGRAFSNLCLLAGAIAPFRTGDGRFVLPAEANTAAVFALADLPPKDQWLFLTEHKQIGAWTEFFREKLPNAARRPITQSQGEQIGIVMPWPWPPSATGKTYAVDDDDDDSGEDVV